MMQCEPDKFSVVYFALGICESIEISQCMWDISWREYISQRAA